MRVHEIREEFPFFGKRGGEEEPLIYFDNGATTQKPQAVIDRLVEYYSRENSNIHRGGLSLKQPGGENV